MPEGRSSIDAAIPVAALLGLYDAADRFWKRVVTDVQAAIEFISSREARRLRTRSTSSTTTPTTTTK